MKEMAAGMIFRRRKRGTTSSDIKAQNLSAILHVLLRSQQVSRMLLARTLGVSNATITNLVGELMRRGLVAEGGTLRGSGRAGRPQRVIQLNDDSRYSIGVHIDVGQINLALCDVRGRLRQTRSFNHALTDTAERVLKTIAIEIEALLLADGIPHERIVGVGIGASGLVDTEQGINVYAPNLDWHDVPMREQLRGLLGLPVVVENNVRAMAFGEALLAPVQDINSLAFIYGRVGVGAGLVIDGQLYHGAAAGAGEIGHSVVRLPSAEREAATLESLISEGAIVREAAARLGQEAVTMEQVLNMARAGHAPMLALLEERGAVLGIAIANLVNIFNPQQIVLGGLYSNALDLLQPTLEATLRHYAFANLDAQVTLRAAHFGDHAGVVGSAALALEAFFYHPRNYAL